MSRLLQCRNDWESEREVQRVATAKLPWLCMVFSTLYPIPLQASTTFELPVQDLVNLNLALHRKLFGDLSSRRNFNRIRDLHN